MSEEAVYLPRLRGGVFFQVALIAALLVGAGFSFFQVGNAAIGFTFVAYLLFSLAFMALLPLVIYRLYALLNATYALERDGLRLRWGLRRVQIPMDEVLWVHPVEGLNAPLRLPVIRWPGSVLGVRRQIELGEVEFLCSRAKGLVLIATAMRCYAVSPDQPQAFMHSFDRFIEMGSLMPLKTVSLYPTMLARQVWESQLARILLASGLALGFLLFLWASLVIPNLGLVTLGFRPDATPGDQVPGPRLMLLPMANTFFLVANTITGLFLFRREESRPLAYLAWGASAFTALLFLVGFYVLLRLSG